LRIRYSRYSGSKAFIPSMGGDPVAQANAGEGLSTALPPSQTSQARRTVDGCG
jgi:hypothetical protein